MNRVDEAISIFERATKQKVFSIRLMEQSHDHELYLINYEIVVRLSAPNAIEQPFRKDFGEYALYHVLNEKQISAPIPSFYYYSPNTFNKIEQFVGGTPIFANGKKEEDALAAIRALSELHSITVPNADFHLLERFKSYKKASGKRLPAIFERKALHSVGILLNSRKPVYCHHHLRAGNVLLQDGNATLVDFEFGGLDASIMDLASLVEENELPSTLARKCLSYYSSLTLESAYSYEELCDAVAFLDGYWYYYLYARYLETQEERFLLAAEHKKQRFLFAFNGYLMGGDD